MPVPETYAGKVTKTDFINVAVELNAKVSAVSPLTLIAGAATAKPLIIKGAASQSANLQEWQDSAGNPLVVLGAAGYLQNGTSYIWDVAAAGVGSQFQAKAAAQKALVVKGFASQTANLQEWQNSSSTPLLSITSSGGIFANNQAGHVFGDSASIGAILNVVLKGNYQGIITRAHTSQTANLQEWQDSAGTVLSAISASGFIDLPVSGVNLSGSWINYRVGGIGQPQNRFITTQPAEKVLVIKGAASQTANPFEVQNSSGTVIGGVNASGQYIYYSGSGGRAQGSYWGQVSIDLPGVGTKYLFVYN